MSAQILQLARSRWTSDARSEAASLLASEAERLHFWRGASGRCYIHSVYGLIECPPMPAANYVLSGKDASGRTIALAIGHVGHDAPTLNLAEIRQRGARLGASEVHIHLLAESEDEARRIELDLKSALHAAGNGNDFVPRAATALAG